jgi:outer membrane protein TolC
MKLLIGFFIFSFLFLASVQAQHVYTWPQCVHEAKNNHPDLDSAHEVIKQSEADKTITASGLYPQVSGDLGAGTSENTSSERSEDYFYRLVASQLIFDGFKISNQIKEAQQRIVASQFSYMVVSSNVRLRLRIAFIELLKAQELLKITENIVTRRQASLDLVKLRYEAGREHRGSLLTAEANLAQAQFDVLQAQRGIHLAQRRLNKELGQAKFVSILVEGNFDVIHSDRQTLEFEQIAEWTPFLKELIARKEAARHGIRSTKADYFPTVFANGDIGRFDSEFPPEEDAWSLGVQVSIPIFEGGIRRASVKKAESVFAQSAADERSGRDGVILTLSETWTRLQDAIDNVEVQSKFLESAQVRAKISEVQYSNGLISFDDWIIIEDNLVNTQKNFLNTQANALIAEANWIQAKGGTLENES